MTGKSILLVDDSVHNLKLTRFLLGREGFDVRTAENANKPCSRSRSISRA